VPAFQAGDDRLIRFTATSNVVQTAEFLGVYQEMRVRIPSLRSLFVSAKIFVIVGIHNFLRNLVSGKKWYRGRFGVFPPSVVLHPSENRYIHRSNHVNHQTATSIYSCSQLYEDMNYNLRDAIEFILRQAAS
jgi:hypothetical protein